MEKDINKMVEEFMANHGRRELSEGELDQVVGGDVSGVYVNGRYYTEDEVNSLAINMTKQFGYDIAFDVFCKMYGFSPNEKSHDGSATDLEKMGKTLAQFWRTMDKIEDKGWSY